MGVHHAMAGPIISLALLCLLVQSAWSSISGAQLVAPVKSSRRYPLEVERMVRERLQRLRGATPRIDGRWSEWSPWGPCSRSCGGGVAVQSRQCISRPQDSRLGRGRRRRRAERPPKPGNQCVGLYKRHQLCNEKACPGVHVDFRTEQCAAFNSRPFRGKKYVWQPYLAAAEECELNCRPVGESFYATLNRTIHDGTSCGRPKTLQGTSVAKRTQGVCVEGKCWAVGPNGMLGADLSMSRVIRPGPSSIPHNLVTATPCSACKAPNVCRPVSGLFLRPQMTPGYSIVTTIPKGACYVNVTQLRPSRNHLALRNPDGTYMLNGNWVMNVSGSFEAAGAKLAYHRQDNTAGESISGVGPLQHPLDVVLIYQVPNPGIKYDYHIAFGTPIPTGEQIAPPLIDKRRLEHSVPTVPQIAARRLERPAHNQADEAHRGGGSAHHRVSKSRRKKFGWKVARLTACSKTCGGGTQSTIIICVREHNQVPAADRRCAHLEKPPSNTIRCAPLPCPAHWVGEWSACSAACGRGEQTRKLDCVQEVNANLTMVVKEGACMEVKPAARRPCFGQKCDVGPDDRDMEISSNDLSVEDSTSKPFWKTGSWSQCSASCGGAHRVRSVTCVGIRKVGDGCSPEQRPHTKEPCNGLPVCPQEGPPPPPPPPSRAHSGGGGSERNPWLYTDWSQHCSDDCGTGHQYRAVTCGHLDACPAHLRPETTRACSSDKHCGGKWYAGPWGRCVDPCGANPLQRRDVLCVVHVHGQSLIVMEKTCPLAARPTSERACTEPCPAQWFTSDWSGCEGACDAATQRRDVRCLDHREKDVNTCEGDRPSVKRTCEPAHCSRARDPQESQRTIGDQPAVDSGCVDKINFCQAAVQARLCPYEYYQTVCCLSCSRAQDSPRD